MNTNCKQNNASATPGLWRRARYTCLPLAMLLFINPGCRKADPYNPVPTTDLTEVKVPDGFYFETMHTVTISVRTVNNEGKPLPFVPFKLSTPSLNTTDASELSIRAQTDENGTFEMPVNVAKMCHNFLLTTDFPGLLGVTSTELIGDHLEIVVGAENRVTPTDAANAAFNQSSGRYKSVGAYTAFGVPATTFPLGKSLSNTQLKHFAASFPSGTTVAEQHPEWLDKQNVHTIQLVKSAEVNLTFVHEATAGMHAIGYYLIQGNEPPSQAALGKLNIVFPNTSFAGSGGGLHTGHTVSLGSFPAGSTIGWFVVKNGYQPGAQNVSESAEIAFSNPRYNADSRPQMLLLQDEDQQSYLLGIEDGDETESAADYNDVLLSVEVRPFTAVNRSNVGKSENELKDSDDDGVDDFHDTDPSSAKSATDIETKGSLVLEDLFPHQGDYDMNDMVLEYTIIENMTGGGNNRVSKVNINTKVKAAGATQFNGFGVQLNCASNLVKTVKQGKLTPGFIVRNYNGTEAGQTKAVGILFDNVHAMMGESGKSPINTDPSRGEVDDYETTLEFQFAAPQQRSVVGVPPYNPFFILGGERGREVHLPNYASTSLANPAFRTDGDHKNGRYITNNGMPWILQVPTEFRYPKETVSIDQGYVHFTEWIMSGGALYPDWYMNKNGYRNKANLY